MWTNVHNKTINSIYVFTIKEFLYKYFSLCIGVGLNNSVSSNSSFGSKSCKSERLGKGSSEFSTTEFIAGPAECKY